MKINFNTQMLIETFRVFFNKINLQNFFQSQFKISRIGFIGRFTFFLITPLIFTWVMFDPLIQIELDNTNEPQYIQKSEINKDLTKSLLADFFQTSLNLGWYQLCLENNGALEMGGKVVSNRPDKRGEVWIEVGEVIPSPFLQSYQKLSALPLEHENCLIIGSDIKGIKIGTSTVALGTSENDLPTEKVWVSENNYNYNFSFDFTKLHLYIKQHWLAFVVKYIVLLVIWVSSVTFLLKLIDLLGLRKRPKE